MTDEDDRPARAGNDALRHGYVVSERCRRVLDDADLVAILLQDLVHVFPTRTVDETAMDQNDGTEGGGCNAVHNSSPVLFVWRARTPSPWVTFYAPGFSI